MSDTRQNGDRRLGFALVLFLVALGLYSQCSVIIPAAEVRELRPECVTGDVYVKGDDVFACQNGVLEPMITLSRSETAVAATAASFSVGALVIGLGFGAAIQRRKP